MEGLLQLPMLTQGGKKKPKYYNCQLTLHILHQDQLEPMCQIQGLRANCGLLRHFMWSARPSKVHDFMWQHKSFLNPIPPIGTRGICSEFAEPSVNYSLNSGWGNGSDWGSDRDSSIHIGSAATNISVRQEKIIINWTACIIKMHKYQKFVFVLALGSLDKLLAMCLCRHITTKHKPGLWFLNMTIDEW